MFKPRILLDTTLPQKPNGLILESIFIKSRQSVLNLR